ncbi:MAG: nitrogen fixation protein NifZ [Trichodesmium sp.]
MKVDEVIELDRAPVFELEQKVRVCKVVRNDGTFPGKNRGDILLEGGEIGYICGIGTFLQKFYIYSVHFIKKGMIIGCRQNELEIVEEN